MGGWSQEEEDPRRGSQEIRLLFEKAFDEY